MFSKNAVALIWYHPSRGSLITNIQKQAPPPDNPAPVAEGTMLRHGPMLGVAVADRELHGVPIAANSVAVSCTHSLSRFSDLDRGHTNVWSLATSQVLTGDLVVAAAEDPEAFIKRFMKLENELMERKRAEAQAQRKKKKGPPGKRRS